MTEYVTRFAPSPTGYLHLGHAASAFHVWRSAEDAGGRVLLRIEDTDLGRCKPEYTEAILTDLDWLGFRWDGDVRLQSDHFREYDLAIKRLSELGLTYRCFRSRTDIAEEQAAKGLPPGTPFTGAALSASEENARIEAGQPFTLRLSLARCREHLGALYDQLGFELQPLNGPRQTIRAQPDLHGDINLTRKDSPVAYHIASTHDDHLQGISHVVRGDDLKDAAHIHVLLQVLLGWKQPVYTHHPLVMGPDGKRLAKRFASQSIASLRKDGLSPDQVRRLAGV